MSVGESEDPGILNIKLNGQRIEVVNSLEYLGSCEEEVSHPSGGNQVLVEKTTVFRVLNSTRLSFAFSPHISRIVLRDSAERDKIAKTAA